MMTLLTTVPLLAISLLLAVSTPASAQTVTPSIEDRLRKLEQHQQELEAELEKKDARIEELENRLERTSPVTTETAPAAPPVTTEEAGAPTPATTTQEQSTIQLESEAGARPTTEEATTADTESPDEWGPYASGKGFKVASTPYGDLNISAYALARYINQLPEDQSYTDHLDRTFEVDTRQDFSLHRVLVHLRGWMYDPKFRYHISVWTVNSLEDVRLIGNLSYKFADEFTLYAGVGGLPGTRSLQGSHPLWLAHDRVMADEFMRPGFTQGVWANGEILPRLWYNVMVANNLSALGVNAVELTRDLAYGGSIWWMPTTGEFGPQGGYGDFEWHDQLATRFGASYTISPKEDRNSQPSQGQPDNTQIRIGDAALLFATDSLVPGVTVDKTRYQLAAMDVGFKYKGFFLQTEGYYRRLDKFTSDGPLPLGSIEDTGFYVQGSFFPIPKTLELYTATSFIFTDDEIEMDNENLAYEYLFGANWFPFKTRYHRLNLQVIDVTRSPVGSSFGFYTSGLTGTSLSLAASVMF
jgi:hypothetical protein